MAGSPLWGAAMKRILLIVLVTYLGYGGTDLLHAALTEYPGTSLPSFGGKGRDSASEFELDCPR
jgi:hypothetical protein